MDEIQEKQLFVIDATKQIVAALCAGHVAHPGNAMPAPSELANHAYQVADAAYECLKEAGWFGRHTHTVRS